jgi:hypothetical protein
LGTSQPDNPENAVAEGNGRVQKINKSASSLTKKSAIAEELSDWSPCAFPRATRLIPYTCDRHFFCLPFCLQKFWAFKRSAATGLTQWRGAHSMAGHNEKDHHINDGGIRRRDGCQRGGYACEGCQSAAHALLA